MEAVAERYFNSGDMKSAASFYSNLMVLHPRYVKMARVCRVLANPMDVPQPHRYADVVEALLEPSVTPAALFGIDASPQAVNKAYQRWTLFVHPDKNPYPRAGEAFNRLVAMKMRALEVDDFNTKNVPRDDDGGGNGSHRCTQRRPPQNRNSDSPATRNRAGDGTPSSLKAAEIDMNLSELKKVQVTLKSLKRKDIDDSELPELNTTFRDIRERRFLSRPMSPLASSVPSMPVHTFPLEASDSCVSSPLPQTFSFTPGASPPVNLPQFEAETSKQQTMCTSSANKHVPSHVQPGTDRVGKPKQKRQQDGMIKRRSSRPSTVRGEKVSKEAVVEAETETETETEANISMNGVAHPSENTSPSPNPTLVDAPVSSCGGGDDAIAEGGASLSDAAKMGIKELIRGLQEIKITQTPLRLNCDLTFAAYERERRQQQQQQQQQQQ